jgi:serine/threonine protein kinase
MSGNIIAKSEKGGIWKRKKFTAGQSMSSEPERKRTVADFEFEDEIGQGSYSTVVKVIEKANGAVFAAKILDKRHIIKENKVKYVNVEKEVLNQLQHPFIIKLWYTFQDSASLCKQ